MRILIVEDDRSVAQLLSNFLKAKGCTVTVAYDAVQALTAMMRTNPEAILLDVVLPGGSGLDLLRKVKASTKTNMVRVVVMSASADPGVRRSAEQLGADEFIPKPLDLDRLYEKVTRLVGTNKGAAAAAGPPAGEVTQAAILETLRAELARARREVSSLGVVVAQIDNFARLATVHGAAGAESISREADERLRRTLRPYDSIGAYGAGRFMLILPGCSATAAAKKAERFRDAVRERPVSTPEGLVPVTLSVGVAATVVGEETDADALVLAALQAVGRAEIGGGDRVELSSELTGPHAS